MSSLRLSIELKKPGVPAGSAFEQNLKHYKQQIPALREYKPRALEPESAALRENVRRIEQRVANLLSANALP